MLAGDAGEYGAGGYSLTGELDAEIEISYDELQLEAVQSHQFHSTRRELDCLHRMLVVLTERVPGTLRGQRVTYLTDSLAAFEWVMGMRARDPADLGRILQIYDLCHAWDLELNVVWTARGRPVDTAGDVARSCLLVRRQRRATPR